MVAPASRDTVQLRRMSRLPIRGRTSARYVAWMDLALSFTGFAVAIVCFIFGYRGSRYLYDRSVVKNDGIQLNITLSFSTALIWFVGLPVVFLSFLKFTAGRNLLSATEQGCGARKARVRTDLWLTLTTYSLILTLFLSVISSPILARIPILSFLQQHICLVSYIVTVLVGQFVSLLIVGKYYINLDMDINPHYWPASASANYHPVVAAAVSAPKSAPLTGVTVKK